MKVPFFRVALSDEAIEAVTEVLRSGWLTTGANVRLFEQRFARAVGSEHAVALNSCTAALHLGMEALELRPGQGVLIPTMTFAATAEVVRYHGAVPILVDCDADTLLLDFTDAAAKLEAAGKGRLPGCTPGMEIVGISPVHVGGLMIDLAELRRFAEANSLWIVEDAAHAFPAAWRAGPTQPWTKCGEGTGDVSCFSFYANKTITTGEGGMAVTSRRDLADRIRLMSLHGLSSDAWGRYEGRGSWDYRILAPGYKYNLTDIAGALGVHELARAEEYRRARQRVARRYREALSECEPIAQPPEPLDRIHAWHLYPIRLDPNALQRDTFVDRLAARGVGFSVHWRPLHLHPYYAEMGWTSAQLPVASRVWETLVSLPMFPDMTDAEHDYVVESIKKVLSRASSTAAG